MAFDFRNPLHRGGANNWAYIWTLTCWMNRSLSILPNVNLIANAGFGADSAHAKGEACWISSRPAEAIGPLVHPAFMARDRAADQYTFDHVYPGRKMRKELCWRYRLKKRLWRMKEELLS